jgi:hypothetical protein
VTNVRVTGDDRENRRRMDEEARRQELRGKLLAEAEHSARRNATVAMRWADLFGIEVPQDLHAEIEQQRLACEKIIGSKVSSRVLASRSLPASAHVRVGDHPAQGSTSTTMVKAGTMTALRVSRRRIARDGWGIDGERVSSRLELDVAGRRDK